MFSRRGFLTGIAAACSGIVLPKVPAIEVVAADWKPTVFRIGFGNGSVQGHDLSKVYDLLYDGLNQIRTDGLLRLQRALLDTNTPMVFCGPIVTPAPSSNSSAVALCPMVAALPGVQRDKLAAIRHIRSGSSLRDQYRQLGYEDFNVDLGWQPFGALRPGPDTRITDKLGKPLNTYVKQLQVARREGVTEAVDHLLRERRAVRRLAVASRKEDNVQQTRIH